jgi:hypothetical protein
LPRVDEQGPLTRLRKGTLLGNMLSAAYRMRRVPGNATRARRAAAADAADLAPLDSRREYRAVYIVPAGPGDWVPLRDTIESILAYEGDGAKVVVVDDGSVDCRRAAVQAQFPQVEVARRRWPSGGPPRNLPVVADGIRFALRHYSFPVLLKMDTDALVTGASPSLAAARLFEARPQAGMAGTIYTRADGQPESYEWDRWVLPHSERWSPSARRLMRRARAGGYDGAKVHGGIYAVSRPALEAVEASGDLAWPSPWWTPLGEDFWLSVIVLANGFELASMGAPGEAFAVASKFTPIANDRVLAEGKLAIHSVRRGADGEDEEEVRRFFRRAREAAQTRSASSPATEASGPPDR